MAEICLSIFNDVPPKIKLSSSQNSYLIITFNNIYLDENEIFLPQLNCHVSTIRKAVKNDSSVLQLLHPLVEQVPKGLNVYPIQI